MTAGGQQHEDDIAYPSGIAFAVTHLACIAVFWTGIDLASVVIAVGLYGVRMFAVTAGYHRYFSHRAFRTSRVFQFLLALLAQSSAQRGILWWAAKHRHHHRHSDTVEDVHSPVQRGFLYSHLGWIFVRRHDATDYAAVRDLAGFRELVWLDRHPYLPAAMLGVAVWLLAGWSGLVVGFAWSTVAVWHSTFCINSLAHVAGRQRFVTGDQSRNNWLLALLTLGEGWHNNHHACQTSARQGFRWWELDPTFYALRALAWIGVVWDLQHPPAALLRGEQRLGRKVIDRVALQLAVSFPVNQIVQEALASARLRAEGLWRDIDLLHVPSLEEVHAYAKAHLPHTPSLDEIATRARERLLELVRSRLSEALAPA